MDTKKATNATPFAHLLKASPEALASMREVVAASIRRDREQAAEREAAPAVRKAQEVAAQIVRCNNARLGILPMPTPITELGERIVAADKRRRGE